MSTVLVGSLCTPAVADAWYPEQIEGSISHVISDTFGAYSPMSTVLAEPDSVVAINMKGDGTPAEMSKDLLCTSYLTEPCSDPKTGFNMRILLPPCSDSITEWCIVNLAVGKSDQALVSGKLLRSSTGRSFAADPTRGLPAAGNVSMWQAPGVTHLGGTDTYAVTVMMDAGKLSTSREPFVYGLTASVVPYKDTSDGFFRAPTASQDPTRRPWPVDWRSDGNNCVWVEDNLCGRRQDFEDETRINLQLRLGNKVTGWLNGRLSDPTVEVTKVSGTQNLVSVTGSAVEVPQIRAALSRSEWTEIGSKNPGVFNANGGSSRADDWPSVSKQLPILSPYLKDTASAVLTQWSFATTTSAFTNTCLRDSTRLVGLVTTNSAVYESGAPTFSNSFLQYQVGGLHYLPDGKEAFGIYDLYMRSDAARCLYGFSSAPLSATVSITGAGGTQNVATTVLKESEGWLHLRAAGFTFSTKTIRIQLKGKPLPKAKPKTIKCKRGNKITVVRGSTCPVGSKKVS